MYASGMVLERLNGGAYELCGTARIVWVVGGFLAG